MVASARGSRAFVVAAIMASMFMIAIETTIVSTAMPLIVAQLGGMDYLCLGVRGVSARADRDHGRVRQARGRLRPQARHARRHRHFPRGLAPRRVRVVDAVADTVSADPGYRGRCGAAGRDDDRGRSVSRPRARQGAGLSRQRVGVLGHRRTGRGRCDRPCPVVVLDFLDQHPDRLGGGGCVHRLAAR